MGNTLDRLLSKAGVCSRTQASALVRAGRVRVNGERSVDPAARVDLERDDVRVDGVRIEARQRIYVALHKPRGVLTTRADPQGRRTVYDLLGDLDAWVVPVGRLDGDTSGLLLFTNDTLFSDLVTNPDSHVEKTYRVEARPRISPEALDRLRAGPRLTDGPTRPARVELLGNRGPATRFDIVISEGRNRQVRRMVRAVGSKVERLQRTRIGTLELGELAPGAWRELSAAEVRSLRAAARSSGPPPDSPRARR